MFKDCYRSKSGGLGFPRGGGCQRFRCILVFSLVFFVHEFAFAQSERLAAAEAVFVEAKALFKDGRLAEACAKFALSQQLDASAGTLLNLARCRQREGKTASAWSAYLAAQRLAVSTGREKLAEEAAKKAEELDKYLAYMTVRVAEVTPAMKVYRAGQEVLPTVFEEKVPVDPGAIVIEAIAPGYQKWSIELLVRDHDDHLVTIPLMLAERKVERKVSPQPDHSIAFWVAGAGLAVTGAGLVFGGLAIGANNQAKDACSSAVDCNEEALRAESRRDTFATIATIGVAAGLAGLASGVFLWALRTPEEPSTARITPEIFGVPGGAVARIGGVF